MSDTELLQRLEALEAIQSVQALKSRYLSCCDLKDSRGFRACFADGVVDIDYGPIGRFDNADALTAIFEQIGCQPHMLEWHHASNPQIELLRPDHARGRWSLQYQLINTQDSTLTQLGGEYADEYRRIDRDWKITATRFVPRTQVVLQLDPQAVKALAVGTPG